LDEVFATQETFKERVLCPLSETLEHFVDFGTPLIVGNIVSNHVTGDQAAIIARDFGFHCSLINE
jgi:hypothetical protein